jgi:hypothetical protein
MHSTIEVIKPADDVSLITLYEAKVALRITEDTYDELLEQVIKWASGEIATLCNRVFARETVIETFYELENVSRIYLSRWPVKEITAIDNDGTSLTSGVDYSLDKNSGKLTMVSTGTWYAPFSVAYTGGYLLPFEAPMALRNAAVLLSREAYYASARGDSTVRMISHKDSRIIYFDPNSKTSPSGSTSSQGGGTAAQRAVGDLLKRFVRIEV